MSFLFRTDDVRSPDRFDYFYEAVAKTYVRCEISIPDNACFSAEIDARPLGAVCLSVIKTSALRANVMRTRHDVSASDNLFLQMGEAGQSCVAQDGREVVTRAGEMALLDTARPYAVKNDDATRHLVIEIPRRELEARLGPLDALTGRSFSMSKSAEAALAVRFLRTLFRKLEGLGVASAEPLAGQAIDLAALALSNGARETVSRLSSLAAISRLRLHHAVETSFADAEASCSRIAGLAGISTHYANMLLAQEGTTLERLVMLRRLEKCRDSLTDAGQQGDAIADIARRWGFVNGSHFSRLFRQTYGLTARDFRHAHRSGEGI